MIRTLPAAMILTAVLAPAPALAKGTIIVAPVYSQLVAFPAPAGFHAINEAEQDGSYILELAPQRRHARRMEPDADPDRCQGRGQRPKRA